MKKKILVFPAGTEIAFEIHRALKHSKFVELYGGTSVSCHADFVFKNYIDGFPYISEDGFIDFINGVIDKYGIDFVYPAHDSALMTLTARQEELHAKVVSSSLETVEICRSKNKTYKYLKGKSYIPRIFHSIEEIVDYPVFAKPSVGEGSNGAEIIFNLDDLKRKLEDGAEYTISEYLPGNEYTVDCFTDRHGRLRTVHIRERERIRSGIAVRSRLVELDSTVKEIAKDINSSFEFNGAWFFQLKKNTNGEYRLLEISPRIPGTMGVSRNLGINYPLLTLYNIWGYDVDILDNNKSILLDRAFISRYKTDIDYSTVYLDFDDTLCIDGYINVEMVAFVYQCINQGKKIVLLTKHDGNLNSDLDKFKISSTIFDEIIHIENGADKSQYITEKKSIFIDDSFAERKNIQEKCGIPVFDLDMIESLLDWRL